MWLFLFIAAAIGLMVIGLISGTFWFTWPAVALAAIAAVVYWLGLRAADDRVGRIESGPDTDPSGRPQATRGHAHPGQREEPAARH